MLEVRKNCRHGGVSVPEEGMSKVINLATYRGRSRKAYLAKHGARIDLFVQKFLQLNLDVDFEQLTLDYQAGRFGGESSWDYIHFRELLADAMDEAFGTVLYQMLQKQVWFDQRLITQEQVIDRCLSSFVMAGCEYQVKGK